MFLRGGTEGLGTKIVGMFKGLLRDSYFSDFEADGSGIRAFTSATNATFFVLFQIGIHLHLLHFWLILAELSTTSPLHDFESFCILICRAVTTARTLQLNAVSTSVFLS